MGDAKLEVQTDGRPSATGKAMIPMDRTVLRKVRQSGAFWAQKIDDWLGRVDLARKTVVVLDCPASGIAEQTIVRRLEESYGFRVLRVDGLAQELGRTISRSIVIPRTAAAEDDGVSNFHAESVVGVFQDWLGDRFVVAKVLDRVHRSPDHEDRWLVLDLRAGDTEEIGVLRAQENVRFIWTKPTAGSGRDTRVRAWTFNQDRAPGTENQREGWSLVDEPAGTHDLKKLDRAMEAFGIAQRSNWVAGLAGNLWSLAMLTLGFYVFSVFWRFTGPAGKCFTVAATGVLVLPGKFYKNRIFVAAVSAAVVIAAAWAAAVGPE
jgi:hypothetical protein